MFTACPSIINAVVTVHCTFYYLDNIKALMVHNSNSQCKNTWPTSYNPKAITSNKTTWRHGFRLQLPIQLIKNGNEGCHKQIKGGLIWCGFLLWLHSHNQSIVALLRKVVLCLISQSGIFVLYGKVAMCLKFTMWAFCRMID